MEGPHAEEVDLVEEVMIAVDMIVATLLEAVIVAGIVVDPEDTHHTKSTHGCC